MTWLDLVCGLLLALVAMGGYDQGAIRGLLRLLGVLAGGAFGVLVMARLGSRETATATAVWAVALALLGIGAAAGIAWGAAQAVPRFVHAMLANRLLGVLPALVAGLIMAALGLSLAERLAAAPETQAFIRDGILTGPLVGAVDFVEQVVAGVR